ncbi:MAG: hypothetical protein KC912_25015 [Proteobacteria bacterium]|nr:hypothetical protein [Pseudomonadota bacterium]
MRSLLPGLFFLLAACGTGTVWNPPIQADLDAAYTTCADGESCVIVQLGCCDHCNGGAAVAVNSGSLSTVVDELGEDCSGQFACTEMGCAPITAECRDDACVMVEGEL